LRKYAEGDLGEDRSFVFRGPKGALKLRAQNLAVFVHIAEGVDDETWMHHLRRSDYSGWMQSAIKDQTLSEEVHRVEMDETLSPEGSRRRIRELIDRRYTLPTASVVRDSPRSR
jgi:hypothetical protein